MTRPMLWGVGTSDYGSFPERRGESLAWDAIAEAVRDAGITPSDIDAIVVGSVFGPPGVATRVQRGIGVPGVPMWTVENACASGTSAYPEAVEAVGAGVRNAVADIPSARPAPRSSPRSPGSSAGAPAPGR